MHRDELDPQEPFVFKFTKGLRHKRNGLLHDLNDFVKFRQGTEAYPKSAHSKLIIGGTIVYGPVDDDLLGRAFARA